MKSGMGIERIRKEGIDALSKKLGDRALTERAYRQMVLQLLHRHNNVRDGLAEVVTLASPFERELVLEIQWARADIKKTEAMRKILLDELKDE